MIEEGEIVYDCKDNDVELRMQIFDGKIDEIWVGVKGMKEWTIVGYKDLKSAIKKANKILAK